MDRFGPHPDFGFGWWPDMLFSVLGTLFWLALLVGLTLLLLKWVLPNIRPMISNMFGAQPVMHADLSPMEILRRRYAAGEIDTETFEQMRERLETPYQRNEPWASQ